MIFIEPKSFDPAFHFATEEFCMNHFQGETIWMLWRTDKCIMLGSNQVPALEIDLEAAKKHNVTIVRRPSGGGTIFTDPGTIQYSVITPYTKGMDTKKIKEEVLAAAMLQVINNRLNVPAKLQGRNDITIEGRKISGLAQHISHEQLCGHGSLLYDTDLELLTEVLNPSEDKIQSKSIKSVRSRVTSLRSYLNPPLSTKDFFDFLKNEWLLQNNMDEYTLTESDIAAINKIRLKKYANDEWTYGKTPKFTYHNRAKYQMGIVEVFLKIEKGIITDCSIKGDFLGLLPIGGLQDVLVGLSYHRGVVEEALDKVDISPYLGGVTMEQFIDTMF
jgi:lipoate-protein ligase A